MSLSRYMAHVVRPLGEAGRTRDLLSWKMLGTGWLNRGLGENVIADPEGRARPRSQLDWRLCCGLNKHGLACTAWGSFQSPDGRRWCHAHRVHEAERR